MPKKTVNITQIRQILAGEGHDPLTEVAIGEFVRDGMPKEGRGAYDALKCLTWYVGRLRTAAKKRAGETADGKVVSLDLAQRRLTLAKAENEEMTAKERRGELVPLSLYVSEMAKLVTVVKGKLLNLPARMAPKLEGLSRNESKALLTAAVKSALTELADPNEHASVQPRRRRRA